MRKAAMTLFRHLPRWLRRITVRIATPSYTLGAVVVLARPDGTVLMVEQRHSGGWAFPGGLLRHGERAADAAVREVDEEVGVSLQVDTLPLPVAAVNPRVRRVDLVYLVPVEPDLPARRRDRVEVRRVEWRRLEATDDVSEPTREILREVRLC